MESDLFARMEKMLAKICAKFRTEGICYDELRAEANYSFLKAVRSYQPNRCKVTTWIWKRVHYDLMSFVQKEKQQRDRLCLTTGGELEVFLLVREENQTRRFNQMIDGLSPDSQMVIDVMTNTPEEIEESLDPPHRWMKVYRKAIRAHFQNKHDWSKRRVDSAFRQIENAL